MARGILVTQSGLKPPSLGLEGGFLTIGPPGSPALGFLPTQTLPYLFKIWTENSTA